MEQKIVRKLERELEAAIAEVVILRNKKWKYPLLPSRHTLQMMAKAAAAVYEAADENYGRDRERAEEAVNERHCRSYSSRQIQLMTRPLPAALLDLAT